MTGLQIFLLIVFPPLFALVVWLTNAAYREIRLFYRKPWKPRRSWREW
ncbi:MAG: hypothetical protein AB7G40_08370 [Hyphomonadaceae bacterium]